MTRYLLLLTFTLLLSCQPKTEKLQESSPDPKKPRTIVTTDGEIDDVDSFIRMLLYANEFKIEGLVYSSSMWHYAGDGKGTEFTSEMEMTKRMYGAKTDLRWPGVEWMNPLLDAYEEVYPKLSQHAEGFPAAAHLRSLVRVGNIKFEGEMEEDTPGSDFIKEKLLDATTEPIYLQVWGGTNTIARALKSIEDEHKDTPQWDSIYQKVIDKAIIYAILDQDATYRKYIAPNWPDLKIYYNSSQFWCFAYAWKRAVPESQHYLFEGEYMGNEIINNHGPLLKQYYSYGDGQKQEGDDEHIHGDSTKLVNAQWGTFGVYDFISEGDSPAYLHLIDVGLDNLSQPQWGGWGGRLVQSAEQPNRWEDGENVLDFNPFTDTLDATYPQIRWVEAIQQDFAARADWCVMDYAEANHPPVVEAKGATQLSAKPGESLSLEVQSSDPDGDQLSTVFWVYKEVGTYTGEVGLSQAGNRVTLDLDPSAKGQLHVIAEVKDSGTHPMTRYQRFVVEVEK
ncbi:DUF1593 domain-containing protein [Algoriphagus aestuariicola]|uniref:DUF1593 domain-containing protein n=1 Tax=Algoriphagus aestuariicola TaxID=1852016 RepID=A0ABS3BJC9_9BACT|nr:DUF1593 domain-containing protein [Algoriphagus aestuariicola]MBN7799398.1 DUF1593 domain-containing protein [Algoriphagus aestuariicola]